MLIENLYRRDSAESMSEKSFDDSKSEYSTSSKREEDSFQNIATFLPQSMIGNDDLNFNTLQIGFKMGETNKK